MKKSVVVLLVLCGLLAVLSTGCTGKIKAARHLHRAERYFQAADYDKAEIEYLIALRQSPANPLSIPRLGALYYEQGRFLQAMPYLLKARELDANNLDARLKAARVFLTANQPKEARKEALFILGRQPTNEEAVVLYAEAARTTNEVNESLQQVQKLRQTAGNRAGFHLASAVLALDRRDARTAEAELNEAARLNPRSIDLYMLQAALYLSRNDLTNALNAFKTAAELAPARSLTRLRYIDYRIRSGAAGDARNLLKATLDKAPDYVPAQVQSFKLSIAEGKLDEAEAMVKKVLGRDRINFDALLASAQLKLARGKREDAAKDMQRAILLYPKSAQVRYQSALVRLFKGDQAEAMTSLNQAIALEPDYADAILLLAQLNVRKGDSKPAIESLTQLTRKQPNLLAAHLALAEAYGISGALEEALAIYRRLMQAQPQNPQLPFLAGLILRDQRKPAEALKSFEKALELAPTNLMVIQQMVELNLADKQYERARQLLQKPLTDNPKSAAPRVLLALTYLAQTNTAQAEDTLQEAIEQDENARAAYFFLARIYIASGKQQQALERLQGLTAKNPKDVPALMLMALIHEGATNYPAAATAYERILKINGRFAPALNNLAYLYSERLHKPDAALALARRAREVAPNDPHCADTLGWIAYRGGDYPWAFTLIQECARQLPAEPEIQYHLGMTHYMLAEEDPARAALQRAAQSTRDFLGKAEAQRVLALLNLDSAKGDPQTVATLNQWLNERPGDPVALGRLAAVYEQSGQHEKAAQALEAAVKANPKVALFQARLAHIYAEHLQKPARAMDYARNARKLDSDDPRVALIAGRAASRAGDPAWALSLLQECARKLPGDAAVLYDLAFAAYGAGRLAEAQNAARNAQQADPKSPSAAAAAVLLDLMRLASDPPRAVQSLSRLGEILRTDAGNTAAELALAVANEQQGNVAAARQAYERILARNAGFAPAQRNLALLAERLGDRSKQTFELAIKARQSYPADPDLARAVGMLAYRQGEYAKAARSFRECLGSRTSDAEAHFYLGMAEYQLNDRQQSKAALQKSLALNVRADLAKEATRVLMELR